MKKSVRKAFRYINNLENYNKIDKNVFKIYNKN